MQSLKKVLGPVVQMVDNSIHWVNLYPFDNAMNWFPLQCSRKETGLGSMTRERRLPDLTDDIQVLS